MFTGTREETNHSFICIESPHIETCTSVLFFFPSNLFSVYNTSLRRMTSRPESSFKDSVNDNGTVSAPLSLSQFQNVVTYLLFHFLPEAYLKELAPDDTWNPTFIQYSQHVSQQSVLKLTKVEKKRLEKEILAMKTDYQCLCSSLHAFVKSVFKKHASPSMNPYRVSCVSGNWKKSTASNAKSTSASPILSLTEEEIDDIMDHDGLSEEEDSEQKQDRLFMKNEKEKIDQMQFRPRPDSLPSVWTSTVNGFILLFPAHSFYFEHDVQWSQMWRNAIQKDKNVLSSPSHISSAFDQLSQGRVPESFKECLKLTYKNDQVNEEVVSVLETIEFVAQFPFRLYLYILNEVHTVPLVKMFVSWVKNKKKDDSNNRFEDLLNTLREGEDMIHMFHRFNKKWCVWMKHNE